MNSTHFKAANFDLRNTKPYHGHLSRIGALALKTEMPGLTKRYRTAVCCTTHKRPKMLARLLSSWEKLTIPDNVDPVFVVVENDEQELCRKIVDQAKQWLSPYEVIYATEAMPGIPAVRNKAIETAIAAGADLILFVDDDETVSPQWLAEMVRTYQETGAFLIGGPVFGRFASDNTDTFLLRLIRSGLDARYRRIADKAERKLRNNQGHTITVVTCNWLADARLFTDYEMSFDVSLSETGGSDAKFYRTVSKHHNLPTSWSPRAVVYESVPPERLTPQYQYYRGMEQSRNSIHQKLEEYPKVIVFPMVIGNIAIRAFTLTALLLTIPFNTGPALVRILRSAGWLTGRISGFFGARSRLYENFNGS